MKCAVGLVLALALPARAEDIVYDGGGTTGPLAFATDTAQVTFAPQDIAEAAPLFGDGGPSLRLRLTGPATRALYAFSLQSLGQSVSLSVCGETLFPALLPRPIESGEVAVPVESLGSATWYARVLSGEFPCTGSE
ncbi:hypothetical protein HKCCE3408_13085 [Rhodobacterales bacterium HKCCE3408]|nr:hypothetical protein [Rhodobacterales bacterium HKCCE3408]